MVGGVDVFEGGGGLEHQLGLWSLLVEAGNLAHVV